MDTREIATISAVYSDGVSLKFSDGSISQKHFRCNQGLTVKTGDLVMTTRVGNTYVVDYVIGYPATT